MPRKVAKEGGTAKTARKTYGKKIVKLSKAYAVGQKNARQTLKYGIASPKTEDKIAYYAAMSYSDYPGIKPINRKMIKAARSGRNSVLATGGKDPFGVKPVKSKDTLGKKRQSKVASMARINKVLGTGKTAKKATKKGKK